MNVLPTSIYIVKLGTMSTFSTSSRTTDYRILHYRTQTLVFFHSFSWSIAKLDIRKHSNRFSYLENQRQRLCEQFTHRSPYLLWLHWCPDSPRPREYSGSLYAERTKNSSTTNLYIIFERALSWILLENSFQFYGKHYLQTLGRATSTKIAVAFTNIFMAKVETEIFN